MNIDVPSAIPAAEMSGGLRLAPKKLYHVGTLTYTKLGLAALFAWILWGDFCLQLMEAVVPSILPLKLKSLGTTNLNMALIMTTLPGILNSTICPWVSFRSDRYRSRWGRRMPFILWTLPFLTMFLILLGYSEPIGSWAHHTFFNHANSFPQATVTVFLIGVFMVCFTFFNMFVGSVFWYLFNDVVPEAVLSRFLGVLRMVSGLAGFMYNWYIFPHAETHMKQIFLGAALLYFVGFGLVCLKVKEGEYPPPPQNVGGKTGFWAGLKTFIVESYGLKYYWNFFLTNAFWAMAGGCVGAFSIFFSKNIGLNMEQIGRISAYSSIAYVLLTYPAGILADRFHPLRVLVWASIGLAITPVGIIYLFFNFTPTTVYYISIASSFLPIGLIYGAASFPMYMRILPKERFGQFCSADAIVRSEGILVGGLVAGVLMDLLKSFYHGSDFCYRFIPVWGWIFQLASLTCLLLLYRGWKRHGGPDHYVAPVVGDGK